jgi:endonuclease/exonuclease/phosphatase family metal-dependent hydrolase
MKLMTYNILFGGRSIADTADRRDDILKLIKQHAPDVVALQEANFFDQDDTLERMSSELSLPVHALAQGALYEGDLRYHVVLFSRYPIISTHDFPDEDFQSAALSVLLKTEIGNISVCNVHLHSYVEEKECWN